MKSIQIKQVLLLCTFLVGIFATSGASAADLGSSCVFTKEPRAAFHIDPWAKSGQRFQRFGAVENADEINIQSCKGATNQYLALVIGTRESSLASDGGNIVTSSDLGQERCDFSPGIKAIPWLIPQAQREASIKSRLKTLRSCVALEVTSLNGRPLILGNHPTCTWTTTKSNVYEARGVTCTLKLETNTAISVKPIIEESCQTPARFESGELQPADIETAFQAFITSDALASSTSNLVGVSARRIVFAPSPKVAPFNQEDKIRFPRTLDLKIQPTALDLSTQRTKEDATSFVSLQLLVRNIGSRASSYPVPLAADAELFELSKDASGKEKLKSAGSWTAYASGRTLIPADWSGIFATDRAELRDFAFKNGKRYRIRLKYYHPHDVAGLLRAEFRSRPMSFIPNADSFDIGTIPTMATMNKLPLISNFPVLGKSMQSPEIGSQITNAERQIQQFFRELAVDDAFPVRYNRSCDGDICAQIDNATHIGQSIIDFTAEATPGQVSEMRAVSLDSYTKMATDKTPSAVHFEEREGIRCN